MEAGLIETKIQEKLRPHTDNIRNGTFNDHDILPALFDLILRNQKALTDLTEKQISELKETILRELDAADVKTQNGLKSINDLISNSHAELKGYIQVEAEHAIQRALDYHNAVTGKLHKQRKLGLITLALSCLSLIMTVTIVAILTFR